MQDTDTRKATAWEAIGDFPLSRPDSTTTVVPYAVISAHLDEKADLWYLEARAAPSHDVTLARTEALYVTKDKALSSAHALTGEPSRARSFAILRCGQIKSSSWLK
jgi:hypothetical protein